MPTPYDTLREEWLNDFEDFYFEKGKWEGRPNGVYQYINYIAGLLKAHDLALREAIEGKRRVLNPNKIVPVDIASYTNGFNDGLEVAKALLSSNKE